MNLRTASMASFSASHASVNNCMGSLASFPVSLMSFPISVPAIARPTDSAADGIGGPKYESLVVSGRFPKGLPDDLLYVGAGAAISC